jgi:hypothetical protein
LTVDPLSGADTGSANEASSLIFISDASAEAERLSTALRAKGYSVFDVPLGLLVSRVAVQRPSLVICDADAPGALEVIQRVREVSTGARIAVLFVGEAGRNLEIHREALEVESSGSFSRPVDPELLVRKVESLIGAPSPAKSSPGSSPNRSPVLMAATRRPYRFEGPVSLRPSPVMSGPPPPSSPTSSGAPPPSTHPPLASVPPAAAVVPHARLSPELEMLLGRAEARVRQAQHGTPTLSTERLSPEAELDAILPPDLLAVLDEPLDLDDEDDDAEDGGFGTHGGSDPGGSRPGRTGQGSAAGTGTGGVHREGSGSPPPPSVHAHEPAPPSAVSPPPSAILEADDEAPVTPPAIRTRNPPPMSLRTSLDASEQARGEVTAAPTAPPPPGPSEPPSLTGINDFPPQIDEAQQASTKPPRPEREPQASTPTAAPTPAPLPPPTAAGFGVPEPRFEIPAVLGPGDAVRALARAVRARYTGAVAFEDSAGIRRVLFRDGDFVTAASGADNESLLMFLVQRGDLTNEAAAKLGRKLPQFGRHAGAALIAQGYLRQDELWNVLRAHAEWIVSRVASIDRGGASVEREVPARLTAEPGVFGGATGAEVLLEIVRRVIPPEDAIKRLGGAGTRLVAGPSEALLGECALPAEESEWVRDAQTLSVAEILERTGSRDFATVLYALTELGVLRSASAPPKVSPKTEPPAPDHLDDAALRARIELRRALVEEGDYFALLGVSRDATSYDVKRAYTTLRREFEPERVLSAKNADLREDLDLILEVLDEAYDILSDQVRRERYRRALEASPR